MSYFKALTIFNRAAKRETEGYEAGCEISEEFTPSPDYNSAIEALKTHLKDNNQTLIGFLRFFEKKQEEYRERHPSCGGYTPYCFVVDEVSRYRHESLQKAIKAHKRYMGPNGPTGHGGICHSDAGSGL